MTCTQKSKMHCKHLLLNYGAHLSINSHSFSAPWLLNPSLWRPKNGFHKKNVTSLLKPYLLLNSITNILFLIDIMLKNGVKLLIIHGDTMQFKDTAFPHKTPNSSGLHPKGSFGPMANSVKKNIPQLFSQIGVITNWAFLCKPAWNCHKITELAQNTSKTLYLENWVWRLNHNTKGLFYNKQCLHYKKQPDCIILINPNMTQVKECKKLPIPVCILGSSMHKRLTGGYLQCNTFSCFVTYLLLCVINYVDSNQSK